MFRLKYQSSKLFTTLTAIILTCLCLLLNSLTRINFHRLELPKNKPEFAATDFQAKVYNAKGQLIYSFIAESGSQFPDSSQILMWNIHLQTFSESSGELSADLVSKDGWLDTKSSQAFLGESVVLTALNKDPQQIVYIYTKQVNIDGNSKFAKSSAPVRAVQGKSQMTGVGFTLDYNKQLITLESQVRAIYYVN